MCMSLYICIISCVVCIKVILHKLSYMNGLLLHKLLIIIGSGKSRGIQ